MVADKRAMYRGYFTKTPESTEKMARQMSKTIGLHLLFLVNPNLLSVLTLIVSV